MNSENNLIPHYRFPEFEKFLWKEKKMDQLFHFVRGPFGGALKKEIFTNKGYAVYEQSHAIYNNFTDYRYYITKDKYNELQRFSVKPQDLLMSCSGTMGKFSIVPENYKEGVINQALLKLTVKENNNVHFLKYLLETDLYQHKLLSQSAGGAIKNVVGVSEIKHIATIIPQLNEQQKIAACLSSLDDVIVGHEEKLTILEEHKKGLMQNLFPQEGETKSKYRFPAFEYDGDWVEINILEVASMKARIGWQNLRTEEHLNQGEYYLVTGTDFKNNRVDWDNAKYVSYDRYIQDENIILKEGDILITKDGSIGKVAYVNNIKDKKSTLNNGIFRIRINENYKSEFIFHSFLNNRFKLFLDKLSGGSSIVHLYQKDFEKYAIQLPKNSNEQQKIAEVLSSVDDLIVAQREKIETLKEHKKGLMQGLFPKIES